MKTVKLQLKDKVRQWSKLGFLRGLCAILRIEPQNLHQFLKKSPIWNNEYSDIRFLIWVRIRIGFCIWDNGLMDPDNTETIHWMPDVRLMPT